MTEIIRDTGWSVVTFLVDDNLPWSVVTVSYRVFPLTSLLLTETITGSDLRISLIEQNLINIDTHEILQSDACPASDWPELLNPGF